MSGAGSSEAGVLAPTVGSATPILAFAFPWCPVYLSPDPPSRWTWGHPDGHVITSAKAPSPDAVAA